MKVAVVQSPPAVLDREATLAIAARAIDEAADAGARLVVFPEAYVGGYPDWVWRCRPDDFALAGALHDRLLASAVVVDGDALGPLRAAAKRREVTVVCGLNEREGSFSRSTLYNTVVTLTPDGAIANRHRKLMPTNPERMVWGAGDASGLRVVETPVGRVGSLICWESYMPLARFALYAQGVEIYVAPTWDHGDRWLASMRHVAREGGTWVISATTAMQARDMPSDLPGRAKLYPDDEEWVNPGDSLVVDPTGKVVAGPLHTERAILYADCDPARAAAARRSLDVAGHYGRPDVFRLDIDRSVRVPVSFRGE